MKSADLSYRTPISIHAIDSCMAMPDTNHMRLQRAFSVVASILLSCIVFDSANVTASDRLNWPTRMGATLNSHVLEADAVGLPTEWSEDPKTNIGWKLETPLLVAKRPKSSN